MSTTVRVIALVAAGALLISLLIWARGDQHHRGDDIGSLAPTQALTKG